jgi:hypothetical protein
METKVCKKCGIEKPCNEYNKDKYSSDGLRYRCRECTNKEYRDFYNKNRELEIERQVKYQLKNIEVIKQKRNKRFNQKYNSDLLYKLKINVRNRIKHFIFSNNFDIRVNRTFDLVGCSPQELREYIEKQFTEGMSWDNYSLQGWHIDHIIPLSSAETEDDVYRLSHYTNLQPLWCEENYKKSNKL